MVASRKNCAPVHFVFGMRRFSSRPADPRSDPFVCCLRRLIANKMHTEMALARANLDSSRAVSGCATSYRPACEKQWLPPRSPQGATELPPWAGESAKKLVALDAPAKWRYRAPVFNAANPIAGAACSLTSRRAGVSGSSAGHIGIGAQLRPSFTSGPPFAGARCCARGAALEHAEAP